MRTVRIAAAQTKEYCDNIDGALACLVDFATRADNLGLRLVCFPEGFLQGYLTDEPSARRVALQLSSQRFSEILSELQPLRAMIVVGLIEEFEGRLFNTAVVIERGVLLGCYRKKHLLPGESAFTPGTESPIFDLDGLKFGISICFDTNFPETALAIADQGASLIVCPANNMMKREKAEVFRDLHNVVRGARCRETRMWLLSADVTGERDGRVAWGPTALLNPNGEVSSQLPLDSPGLLCIDIPV